MNARNSKERILALKQWRIDEAKTVDECISLCGAYPSDTTIRRIFAKGSEDKPFKESSIAAVELALIGKVYKPDIVIPVEEVVRGQEAAAIHYQSEIRRLRHTVERQAEIIRTLLRIGVICVLFFSSIALYDYLNHHTGFWNTNSSSVWIIKVSFLACITCLLGERVYALHKLKLKFRAEEQAAAEVSL